MTNNKKTTSGKSRSTRAKSKRKGNSTHRKLSYPFHKYPRWVVMLGAIGIISLYVWCFYYFFVSPTGFRWRALYGDAKYPEGYEIHGIDISHYQDNIDWDELSNAMIKGCPVRFIIMKSVTRGWLKNLNLLHLGQIRNFFLAKQIPKRKRLSIFFALDIINVTGIRLLLPIILFLEKQNCG